MAEEGPKRGRLQLILASIPKGSLLGRLVHPLVEERRTLAGRMAWIGLFMLVGFIVVALLADLIAPYNPTLIVDDSNVPPLAVVVIEKNFSFTLAGPTNWSNPNDAKTNDGRLAVSSNVSDTLLLRNFGFRPFTETIRTVEVVVQANSTPAAPDQFVDVKVSADGGLTWSVA